MPEPPEDLMTLTKGSRYRVVSIETREKALVTHGLFKGFAAIGPDDALCLELDKSHKEEAGRTRLIPVHMVLSVDVLEQVKEPKKETRAPEKMFG